MIKEAIDRLISLGGMTIENFEGRPYAVGAGRVEALIPPQADTLHINTLTGIVDYAPTSDTMIHVVDNALVEVISAAFDDMWLTRSTFLRAEHEAPVFSFGQFMPSEQFIIALQSQFVQDERTAAILKVVGNLKDENFTNLNDDGVTQSVTARAGISTVATVAVPNPVTLRPYRTFMEVEQPASKFILRMKQGGYCALFEADGHMWRLEAIKNIKRWLAEKIPGIKIIA